MIYRNIHKPVISELDLMLRDARMFKPSVFEMVWGDRVERHFTADNSIVLYSVFKYPVVSPIVRKRSEHKTPPRRSDKVVVIEGERELFGHIIYVDADGDAVGCYMYAQQGMETYSYSCLESNSGRIRWRIIC